MTDDRGRGDVTVRIGGEAGQGMNAVSGLLGKVFLRSGLWVFTHHDFMSRIRGGHNFSQIRLSESRVRAPAARIDLLVCLDRNTLDLYREGMDGLIIHDPEKSGDTGPAAAHLLPVPLETIAKEKGLDARMANSVASGAALSALGFPLAPLLGLLDETFGSKGEKVVKANQACAQAGYDLAEAIYRGPKLFEPGRASGGARRILISGSEAMALGGLASNVRFYSGYPMSPSTPIMEYLAAKAKDLGLVVEQAEDEIAAVNMAIGASFCGARSMVATSGGGLALMVEAISLAGMTETPLVIVDCQRPGPATGLPTRTEQADLLFAAHGAHGEFPRAIMAPATAEEAFLLTVKAFDLAEKYQTPVFVLGDQHLNDSSWTEEPFDLTNARSGGRSLMSGKELARVPPYRYRRYALTESGVSPRILPGTPGQVLYADSDEHTEEGHITESADIRRQMVGKRLRKGKGLAEEISPPRIFPDDRAGTYVVSWGSTFGAVEEAVGRLRDKGMDVGFLHFSEVYPLPDDAVPMALRDRAELIAVESNATGQFAKLLRMETGLNIEKKVLKFDGRPFSGQELAGAIEGLKGG